MSDSINNVMYTGSGRTYCSCGATLRSEEQQKNKLHVIIQEHNYTDNTLTNQNKYYDMCFYRV